MAERSNEALNKLATALDLNSKTVAETVTL
jgi:hypothetical protein